jgi:hypothetical protein
MQVRLSEILTPELLLKHEQHIRDFLSMEGVSPATPLGDTLLSDRLIKELLEELAGA